MKSLLYFLIPIFLLGSCKKEADNKLCIDGAMRWTDPSTNGVGWELFPNDQYAVGKRVVLKNVPAEFQVESLAVNVCIEETTEVVPCNCSGPYYYFTISSIKRR